jgi:hypothetical protein
VGCLSFFYFDVFEWSSKRSVFDSRCPIQTQRTYVGGIERGERNVALVNIEKIAKALRIPVSELFKGV